MRITKNNSSSLKTRWDYLTKELTQQFSDGDVLNLDSIIYLIGVQELRYGYEIPFILGRLPAKYNGIDYTGAGQQNGIIYDSTKVELKQKVSLDFMDLDLMVIVV